MSMAPNARFRINLLLQLLLKVGIFVAAADETQAQSSKSQARYTLRLPETAKYHPHDIDDLIRQYDSAGAIKPVMKIFGNAEDEKYYDFDSFISLPKDDGNATCAKHYLPLKVHV